MILSFFCFELLSLVCFILRKLQVIGVGGNVAGQLRSLLTTLGVVYRFGIDLDWRDRSAR